jgi:AcrR family transcriptional regulator
VPSDTRERILDASGELFRRHGYTGTGVKQILAEAGAPFGSLYHFFPGGKSALGAATVRRSGFLYGLLLGEYVPPEVDLLEGIRDFFAAAARDLEESDYADACPIATVALEVSSVNEELRLACAEVFDAWIEGGTWRFELAGIEHGLARQLVIQMLAGLEGAFVLARALRSTEPVLAAGAAAGAAIRAALNQEEPGGSSRRRRSARR